MNLTYIYGTNDIAKCLQYQLKKINQVELSGFIVSPEYFSPSRKYFCDLPVFSIDEVANSFLPSDVNVYICIGYKEMNNDRVIVYNRCKEMGFSLLSYIHPSAYIDASELGEGNIIMHNVVIGEYTTIGNCNIFHNGSLLAHGSSIDDFNYFAIHSCIGGNTKIGSRCFFGLNSSVKDGVKIGDKVLIGANAYVNKDIESEKVILPARSIILEGKTGIDFL